MKKNIIILSIVIMLLSSNCFASLESVSIMRLAPLGGSWSGTTFNLPALVKGVKAGIPALEWATLGVTPAIGASVLARMALTTGVGAAVFYGPSMVSYMYDKGYAYIQGELNTTVTSTTYSPAGGASSVACTQASSNIMDGAIYYPDGAAASAAALSGGYDHWGGCQTHSGGEYFTCYSNYKVGSPYASVILRCSPLAPSFVSSQTTTTNTPVTNVNDVVPVVAADLDASNAKARKALEDAIAELQRSNADPAVVASSNVAAYSAAKNDLSSAIPPSVLTDLEAATAEPGAQTNYNNNVVAATAGTVQTPSETTAAVKKALDDDSGVTMPGEPAITNPVKKNLTTIMSSFMNSLNGLPILNTLHGITISCSGSSQLCLNLAANYGGSRCWDAGGIQGSLNMIGSALLSLITILSFIYIFKS